MAEETGGVGDRAVMAADDLSTNSIRDLINNRVREGSTPGRRTDGATLALVVEGGGMRGVVSGGMVTALDRLKLHDVFDFVIGTSAGALAGAYFLARQPAMGTSIYYEDLVGREWLDYRRAVRRRPVVGLDHLIDEVMVDSKPLDTGAVLTSPAPLYAVATLESTFEPDILGPFHTKDELLTALRATARIPIAAGTPVRIGGSLYLDGSMSQSIPASSARELGATHVVALLTRPKGELTGQATRLQRWILFQAANAIHPGLGAALNQRPARYAREIRLLEDLASQGRALLVQLPQGAPTIRQLEQDPGKLQAAAAAGATAVYHALTGENVRFFVGLMPVAEP